MVLKSTSLPKGTELITARASSIELTGSPSISTIRTPTFTPARAAGPSGAVIFVTVRSAPIFIPNPPEALSPLRTLNESKSFSDR